MAEKLKLQKTEHPLKNRNIFILWLGQLISRFGDSLHSTAIGFYVLELTNSSSILGVVEAFTLIPRVFLSLIAGVFTDRYNRKKIIIITDIIRAIVLVALGILAITGLIKVWMIVMVGFVLGACAPFFEPAIQSIKPDLTEKDNLMKMNALFSFSSIGVSIVGKAVAGILIQLIGAPLLILFNGFSFLLSGVSESFLDVPSHETKVVKTTFLADLKSGLNYAYNQKGLRVQYIFILFLNFTSKVGMILTIPFFANTFKNGPTFYGIIMMVGTFGFMVGSAIAPLLKFRVFKRSTLYVLCMIIVGFTKMIFPLTDNLIIIGLSFFISALFISITNVIGSTVLQVRIPRAMRGKVYGFRRTMNTALLPVGAILGGVLGEQYGINVTIAVAYGLCACIGGLLYFSKSHRAFFNFDLEETH